MIVDTGNQMPSYDRKPEMSINLASTTYLSFAEVAKLLPGRPHISTLHRWRTRGVHGVKLATVKIGGRRMVEASSLDQFCEAVTCAADGQAQPIRTSRQREKAIAAAERELAKEGIGAKHTRRGG